MALACQIHGRFIADSSRIHASFFQSQKIKIMSDSRHFHGSFMHFHIQVLPGYRLPKSIGKNYPKSRCWLSICFFCLISASFLAICQIHVGFMALSCYFHGTFLSASQLCRIHRGFMSLSWHFHIQALPGYSLPKSIGKNYPKSRCWLSICFFA